MHSGNRMVTLDIVISLNATAKNRLSVHRVRISLISGVLVPTWRHLIQIVLVPFFVVSHAREAIWLGTIYFVVQQLLMI